MKYSNVVSSILLLMVCLAFASCSTTKKAVNTTSPSTLTMECVQLTSDGNCIIEVQGNGRNIEQATESALVYAVKGVLFDGIPGSTVNRIQSQQPFIKDASIRVTKKEYFEKFFESGDYRLYAEVLPNSLPRIVKIGGNFRVKVSVILKKNLLRKRLEKDGIIKSLASPF